MSMTDPIADMLTRIRNANQVSHASVSMPSSKLKVQLAKLLKEEGFIADYSEKTEGKFKVLEITLKYDAKNKPIITKLERISRDDLRKTIKIEKYEDLKALEGNLVLNNRYELETDILVKKGDSITIGSEAYPFTGIFDGKNFTIRYEMSEGEDLSALFRYVDEKAEIINLRVSGNAKLNEGGVGAAIAAYNRGTIRGCKVDSFRMEVDKYATAGGIAAYNYGNIEGCAARMSVERKGNGGVMQTFFGGMCAKNLDGRVKNAVTYITFTAFKETEIFDNYDEYEGGNYSIGAAVGLNQGETEGLVSAYGDAYLSDRFILEFKSAEELNDSFKFPNK